MNKLIFAFVLASGTIIANNAGADWKSEKKQLDKQIRKIVRKKVDEVVDPEKIAKKYRLPWPIPGPTKPADEIAATVEELVKAAVEEQYPESRIEEIKKEAIDRFKMYVPGEKVTFTIRGGVGRGSYIEDEIFYNKTDVRVQVGSRWINRIDIQEEDQARFYKNVNSVVVDRFAARNIANFREEQARFRKRKELEIGSQEYNKYNYTYMRKSNKWLPLKKAFSMMVNKTRRKYEKQFKPQVENQIFPQHDYVKKEGEWMPQHIWDEIIAEREAEAAAKEAAAQAAASGEPEPTSEDNFEDVFN